MRPMTVTDYSRDGWADSAAAEARARRYCEQLEQGAILQLPSPLLDLSDDDRNFLCGITQIASVAVKNISYQPATGSLRGYAGSDTDAGGLERLLSDYANSVRKVV